MRKSIKVIVIAINDGSGHVFTTSVDVTDVEYRNGEHFRVAVARAAEAGFVSPLIAVESDDLVRLAMEIRSVMAERNAAR